MERFQVDRKLDNRREQIDCTLIRLFFQYGDQGVNRAEIRYKSKSGYCLDAVQKAGHSGFDTIGISEIGKVQTWHSRNAGGGVSYIVYCYPDLENEAMEEIKSKVRMLKARLLLKAIAVPSL